MLQKLILNNFQCHKNNTLNFVQGVNVIAGSSDSGKSALLKGLLWILTNRPQGIAFRTWDCGKGDIVQAEIEIDGNVVSRRRNEQQVNEYILNGQRFVAMKNEVPREIADLLNLSQVNMQTQFQPHYLLSSSAGEVARVLNDACDLSVIDRTIKAINGIVQTAKAAIKATSDALQDISEELEKLDWVEEADTEASLISREFEKLKEKQSRFSALTEMLTSLQIIHTDLAKLQVYEECFADISKLEQEVNEFLPLQRDFNDLNDFIDSLQDVHSRRRKLGSDEIFVSLPSMQQEADDLIKKEADARDLRKLITCLQTTQQDILQVRTSFDLSHKQYEEQWQKLKICPLCGKPVGEAHVH